MTILESVRRAFTQPSAQLPLPLPDSNRVLSGASLRVFEVLKHAVDQTYMKLNVVEEHLFFWENISAGSNQEKKYFLLYKRGPTFFIQSICNLFSRKEPIDSNYITERLTSLSTLRNALAKFLSQIFTAAEHIDEGSTHLSGVNDLLFTLVGEISSLSDSGHVFQLAKVEESSQLIDAAKLVNRNLQTLDTHISPLVAKFGKPSHLRLHWIRYTCCGLGISFCLLWLLRHGSTDVGHWSTEAKRATENFWKSQILVLSSQLTKKREVNERRQGVQLNTDVLHRMLMAFSEKETGEKCSKDSSTQKLLEVVMGRYEKEIMHPLWYLVRGEIAVTVLLQVQKLKLDIEEAMLEKDEILAANQLTLAFLAALPTLLPLGILTMLGAWFVQGARSENQRLAHIQRSFLLVEIERDIKRCQHFSVKGKDEDALSALGLSLYHVDSLYRAMGTPARATGQWISVRRDLLDLGRPGTSCKDKLHTIARMKQYHCFFM